MTALVTAREVMVAAVMALISESFCAPFLLTVSSPPLPVNWERKLSSAALAPRPGVSECVPMRTPVTTPSETPTVMAMSPPKPDAVTESA